MYLAYVGSLEIDRGSWLDEFRTESTTKSWVCLYKMNEELVSTLSLHIKNEILYILLLLDKGGIDFSFLRSFAITALTAQSTNS